MKETQRFSTFHYLKNQKLAKNQFLLANQLKEEDLFSKRCKDKCVHYKRFKY